MINNEPIYATELQYAYSLKDMTEKQLANLMIERTKIVCAEYNKISQIPDIGRMLSGITLAASLMMLSISMGRVLESDDDLKTSKDPQLYKLGSKATGFLTRLATSQIADGGISYIEKFLRDARIDEYQADFLAKVSNPVTRSYLEFPLFGQGGGSLDRGYSIPFDAPTSPNTGNHKVRIPDQLDLEEGFADGGDVAEVSEESEVDMGQSNVLSPTDIALLANMDKSSEDEFLEDEFLENKALFDEVLLLLSRRYDGLEDVFLRILDGNDAGDIIYIDKILKDLEDPRTILAHAPVSEEEQGQGLASPIEGVEPEYEGVEPEDEYSEEESYEEDDTWYPDQLDLEEGFADGGDVSAYGMAPPLRRVEPEDEMVDAPPIEGAQSKKKTKKKHKSRKNKKSIKKKTKRKSKRKNKRKTAKKKKKKKSDLIDKIIDRLGY